MHQKRRPNASLYFAHGTADRQNSIHAFDVLRAELETAGKRAVFQRIADWFLAAR